MAVVLRVMYGFLDAYENHHEPVQSPLVQQTTSDTRTVLPGETMKFPQPRLETDERREINDFREHEEETLHSYGWVDQQGGVVRIPIDRAMELLAQRGLPTRAADGNSSVIGREYGESSGTAVGYKCRAGETEMKGRFGVLCGISLQIFAAKILTSRQIKALTAKDAKTNGYRAV